jgi:DNA repair protein RadD
MILREHQSDCVDSTIDFIGKGEGNPVIVSPTGSGKTLIISALIKHLVVELNAKVLVLSHVKEILEQNHASIASYTGFKVGLYSAMLDSRTIEGVTVAGIQSVYRKADSFRSFDYLLIDEAHLVNIQSETMYHRFFKESNIKTIIGLTATPYRLGSGFIYGKTSETIFDDISCNWGTGDKFNQLISMGYLCKLTTKRTKEEMDTSDIKLTAGDFNEKQMSSKFDREPVTNAIIKEIIAAGKNRKRWLIFAIDINHAEHIAEVLIRNGIPTAPVHSRMNESGFDRSKILKESKSGKYKCLVNVNILTTGYDDPEIDLIAVIRPTNSPVLHVQMLGRGSRPAEGKKECLVLDFAGNTERLGPINDPLIKIKGKGKGGGEPITKTCPACSSIVAPAVRICPDCGHKFKFDHGLTPNSSNAEVIDDGKAHWLNVDHITYELNSNPGTPTSLRVIYHCGNKKINEWICVEHKGFAKHKADHWVKFRGGQVTNSAVDLLNQRIRLKEPVKILVTKKNKYYLISDSKF